MIKFLSSQQQKISSSVTDTFAVVKTVRWEIRCNNEVSSISTEKQTSE
jgi:hypothetical protein